MQYKLDVYVLTELFYFFVEGRIKCQLYKPNENKVSDL